jgi:hypothetical protein
VPVGHPYAGVGLIPQSGIYELGYRKVYTESSWVRSVNRRRLNKEQPKKDTKQEGHGSEQGSLFREQLGKDR